MYDVERGGCDVGNGLDSRRVDVVVDDRATRMETDNHNTVLGVAVERGPAIAITKWAMALLGLQQWTGSMALGRQQGTRLCRTPGTMQ